MPVPPEDYLPLPRQPSMLWKRFAEDFQHYIFIKEIEEKRKVGGANFTPYTDMRKNILFFTALGKEGKRQFKGRPRGDKYDRGHSEFVKDAADIFQRKEKINTLVARKLFNQMNQHSGGASLNG